jgi:methionine aminopeptidase
VNNHLEELKIGGRPMTKNEIKIKELEERIDKAIEDLKRTIKFNKHYKDKYNEWVNVDVDHIKYLLEILKGEDNE